MPAKCSCACARYRSTSATSEPHATSAPAICRCPSPSARIASRANSRVHDPEAMANVRDLYGPRLSYFEFPLESPRRRGRLWPSSPNGPSSARRILKTCRSDAPADDLRRSQSLSPGADEIAGLHLLLHWQTRWEAAGLSCCSTPGKGTDNLPSGPEQAANARVDRSTNDRGFGSFLEAYQQLVLRACVASDLKANRRIVALINLSVFAAAAPKPYRSESSFTEISSDKPWNCLTVVAPSDCLQ